MELGNNIISNTFDSTDELGITNYTDLLFAGTTSNYPGLEDYFDNEEIKKELGEILTNYIKYTIGIPTAEQPNTASLSIYVENCAHNYEKETGHTVDLTVPNAFINNLAINLNKEQQTMDPKIQKVLEILYSENVYTVPIIIMLISILLLIIINRDIASVAINLGTSVLMNAIGTYGLGFGLKTAINKQGLVDDFTNKIIAIFTENFNKVAKICLIVGIILIVFGFVYKKIKTKKEVVPENKFLTYN